MAGSGAVAAVLLCCVRSRKHYQLSHGLDRVDRTVCHFVSAAHPQAATPQVQVALPRTHQTAVQSVFEQEQTCNTEGSSLDNWTRTIKEAAC